MSDANHILRSVRRILLVDWANRGVPRTLVEAGFTVICASPGRYSIVEVVPKPPEEVDSGDVFAPQEGENGYLVFRRLDGRPVSGPGRSGLGHSLGTRTRRLSKRCAEKTGGSRRIDTNSARHATRTRGCERILEREVFCYARRKSKQFLAPARGVFRNSLG
jgi:hypothetical protein